MSDVRNYLAPAYLFIFDVILECHAAYMFTLVVPPPDNDAAMVDHLLTMSLHDVFRQYPSFEEACSSMPPPLIAEFQRQWATGVLEKEFRVMLGRLIEAGVFRAAGSPKYKKNNLEEY